MRRRGFTLIEVFISILVVSGVFFALATIFPSSLSCLRKSQNVITAQYLAQQTMEQYRSLPFKTPTLPGGPYLTQYVNAAPPPANWPSGPPPIGWDGVSYTIMVNVSNYSLVSGASPDGNLCQLDVTVLWSSGSLTGNLVTTDADGNPVPVYADSSVHDSTIVYNVINPF